MFAMQTNAPSGQVFTKNFVVLTLCNDNKGFLFYSISILLTERRATVNTTLWSANES